MKQTIQARYLVKASLNYVIAAIISVIGGLLASTGNIAIVAVFVGSVVGVFFLFKPEILLWFVMLGGLVFAGLAQLYLPQIEHIRWSVGLLSMLLGFIAILDYAFPSHVGERRALPPLFWWLIAFFGIAIISSVSNKVDLGSLVFGFKGYFQVWGLFIAIVLMSWPGKLINRIPKMLVWLGFLQLPFVLHQYLFIVPERRWIGEGIVAEDVIAGTFGATVEGGGANAVLSALLIIGMSILAAFWKQGLLSPLRLIFAVLMLFVPIVLNLSKVSLVYILLAYIVLFRKEILRHPARSLIAGAFSATLIIAVMASYTQFSSKSDSSITWKEYVSDSFDKNVSEGIGYGSYELNRWSSFMFWIKEQDKYHLARTLFGHGLGASREGGGGVGIDKTFARREYPGLGIGLTAITALLWDTGVIGLVLVLCAFWSAYRAAGKLAHVYQEELWMSSVFQGLQVGIAILLLGLFHKNSFVFHLPYQTLLMVMFGYIAYWQRKVLERGTGASDNSQKEQRRLNESVSENV